MAAIYSSFQFAEAPTHYAYKMMGSKSCLHKLAGYGLGWVALPLAVAATPFTILIDGVTAIADASFSLYKKGCNREAVRILYKK